MTAGPSGVSTRGAGAPPWRGWRSPGTSKTQQDGEYRPWSATSPKAAAVASTDSRGASGRAAEKSRARGSARTTGRESSTYVNATFSPVRRRTTLPMASRSVARPQPPVAHRTAAHDASAPGKLRGAPSAAASGTAPNWRILFTPAAAHTTASTSASSPDPRKARAAARAASVRTSAGSCGGFAGSAGSALEAAGTAASRACACSSVAFRRRPLAAASRTWNWCQPMRGTRWSRWASPFAPAVRSRGEPSSRARAPLETSQCPPPGLLILPITLQEPSRHACPSASRWRNSPSRTRATHAWRPWAVDMRDRSVVGVAGHQETAWGRSSHPSRR